MQAHTLIGLGLLVAAPCTALLGSGLSRLALIGAQLAGLLLVLV